jgi:hypothetical protein
LALTERHLLRSRVRPPSLLSPTANKRIPCTLLTSIWGNRGGCYIRAAIARHISRTGVYYYCTLWPREVHEFFCVFGAWTLALFFWGGGGVLAIRG